MKFLEKLFKSPLKILLFLIVLWVIFANFYFGVNLKHTAVALFVITTLIFAIAIAIKKLRLKPKLKKITTKKWFYIAAIIAIFLTGTIARLSFLQYEYSPTWDPGTFYWNAEPLSQTGELVQEVDENTTITREAYFAMYPYEMNYTGLLAIANIIFGGGLFSVIILNILLDILGAALTFLIMKNLLPKQKWPPLIAAAIYFLNPFNIVFSALSLPIIAVNTIIILVIYVVIKFLQKTPSGYKTWQLLAVFAGLGIILAIGNGFCPMFAIILIAILLLVLYLFTSKIIKGKNLTIKTACACLLMLVAYFVTAQLNFSIVDHYAKIPAARNASGWALYLGSNIDYSGKWAYDSPDQDVRTELWQKYPSDMQSVHNELSRLAIERYQANGVAGNVQLYVNKALIANGDQANSMYNASSLIGYEQTQEEIVSEIAKIFTLALSVALLINIYKNWGKGNTAVWIFLSLIIIGFFAGSLLVEVKNRYFTILLPAMILLSVYMPSLSKKKRKP
ncbi:MAG: hypothetical protein ACK5MU_01655 [Candidatus Saccharimonadales bacterium]